MKIVDQLFFLQPVSIKNKIRLGDNADGGYVVYEKLLAQTDALITYGVGSNISFEEHFNQRTNTKVIMFDPTLFGKYLLDIKSFTRLLLRFRLRTALSTIVFSWKIWRRKMSLESRNILFVNEGISAEKKGKYDTLLNHLKRFELTEKRILLKVDIDGGEYEVFGDKTFYNWLGLVNQFILEFHDLKHRLRDIKDIFSELGKHFTLAHIHGNNYSPTFNLYDLTTNGENDLECPDVLEVLWIRTDEIRQEDILDEMPVCPIHNLDYPNNPDRLDYPLRFIR